MCSLPRLYVSKQLTDTDCCDCKGQKSITQQFSLIIHQPKLRYFLFPYPPKCYTRQRVLRRNVFFKRGVSRGSRISFFSQCVQCYKYLTNAWSCKKVVRVTHLEFSSGLNHSTVISEQISPRTQNQPRSV